MSDKVRLGRRQQLMSTAVTSAPAESGPAITAMAARENPLTA